MSSSSLKPQFVQVRIPEIGDMTEVVLIEWLRSDGAEVLAGEPVAELETDKATLELEAPGSGVITHRIEAGSAAAVGAAIALIGERAATESELANTGEIVRSTERDPADGNASFEQRDRRRVSPLARRLAKSLGVDIDQLVGSGRDGRIVRLDVLRAAEGEGSPAASPVAVDDTLQLRADGQHNVSSETANQQTGTAPTTSEPLSRAQFAIARRMVQTQQTVPDFNVTTDVDVECAVALRQEMKTAGIEPLPSINDMVVRACGLALLDFPRLNASFAEDHLELHKEINVGIAVAQAGLLMVPTVFEADKKPLRQISLETSALIARTRAGTISQRDLSGGTFTVSNLGMFGVTKFTAIVNQPQTAILAVGAVSRRAVVLNDEIVSRAVMSVTLSCDHRVVYGAEAAQFISVIKELLENPLGIMM